MNVGPGDEARPPDQADLSRRDFLRRGAAPVVAFIALDAIGGLGLAAGTAPKETKLSTRALFPHPRPRLGRLPRGGICSPGDKPPGLPAPPPLPIFHHPSTPDPQGSNEAYPPPG